MDLIQRFITEHNFEFTLFLTSLNSANQNDAQILYVGDPLYKHAVNMLTFPEHHTSKSYHPNHPANQATANGSRKSLRSWNRAQIHLIHLSSPRPV